MLGNVHLGQKRVFFHYMLCRSNYAGSEIQKRRSIISSFDRNFNILPIFELKLVKNAVKLKYK